MTRQQSIRSRLFSEHDELQGLLQQLRNAAEKADEPTLVRVWGDFESKLLAHLDAEESYLLPAFEQAHPEEAQKIRDEHARIRKLVAELGVRAELHCLRLQTVEALVDELRQHANEEDRWFYQWADETADEPTRARLFEHLAQGAEERLAAWRRKHAS